MVPARKVYSAQSDQTPAALFTLAVSVCVPRVEGVSVSVALPEVRGVVCVVPSSRRYSAEAALPAGSASVNVPTVAASPCHSPSTVRLRQADQVLFQSVPS